MSERPGVLFVCVKNAGKSQMPAGLMRQVAGDAIEIHSAGTRPGTAINPHSARSLLEVGVDIGAEVPTAIDPRLLARMDRVVVLGREATVEEVSGPVFENWDTDEPSTRGIDGPERMRLIRDDIATRVRDLHRRMITGPVTAPDPD